MKRAIIGFVSALAVFSLVGTGVAAMVSGTLVKIDEKGSFYFVKDEKGKEHKIHFDNTTQKSGEIKAGAQVEVDEDNGHAKSVKAMEMKK